jgi:hypothetical protein
MQGIILLLKIVPVACIAVWTSDRLVITSWRFDYPEPVRKGNRE